MGLILVDVSAAQKKLDYLAAKKSGIGGAYINLGTGEDHVSPARVMHYEGFTSVDVPVGAYHVCTPIGDDAEKEGIIFRARARSLGTFTLRPALDIEHKCLTPDGLAQWCLEWRRMVYPTGRPLIYGNRSVIRHLGRASKVLLGWLFIHFDLWLAADTPTVPSPSPWDKCVLWQTPRRSLPWCNEDIDVNEAPYGLEVLLCSKPQ